MTKSRYEFTTSPRKVQPEIKPRKQSKKRELKIVEDLPRQKIEVSAEQKKKQLKLTFIVIAIFAVLLTISYRNSQINEQFSKVQAMKKELSSLEKENEQLKVSIENGLNMNTIEKLAKENLGMQKLTNRQTQYISLPKKDYVEPASEEVVVKETQNWFEKILNKIWDK